MFGDFLDRYCIEILVKERMLLGAIQVELLPVEELVIELVDVAAADDLAGAYGRHRPDDDAGIEGAIDDRLLDGIGGLGLDVEFDVRVLALVALQDPRQRQVGIRDEGVDHPDAERAREAGMDVAHAALEALQIGEQLQTGTVDVTSLVRELETDPATATQAHAQPDLQVLDIAAYRGQAHLQLGLRRCKSAAAGDGAEHTQSPDIAVTDLNGEAARVESHSFPSRQACLDKSSFLVHQSDARITPGNLR